MDKLIKKISLFKENKNNLRSFINCFVNNQKANELFQKSKTFEELKTQNKIKMM